MQVAATVNNRQGEHTATVSTNEALQSVPIPGKTTGFGSAVSGGELLFLALATCYCNDIYREAALRGIAVSEVQVTVYGEFGGPGEPVRSVNYQTTVTADAEERAIEELIRHTDTVAEIQNTLRSARDVRLDKFDAIRRRQPTE